MKSLINVSIIFILLMMCTFTNAFGQGPSKGQGHQDPPPEAFTACEGKSAGDTAEFVSPRGDTVCGTCEQDGDRLVLRPDNPKPRSGGKTGESQRGNQE